VKLGPVKLGVLVDAGPLVALLNANDRHHAWAKAMFGAIRPPLLTCEAVLSEACHLLQRAGHPAEPMLRLAEGGVVATAFRLDEQVDSVRRLMHRYRSVPMSLADACLVRLTELNDRSELLTIDSDFRIYRKHGRRTIATLMPRKT